MLLSVARDKYRVGFPLTVQDGKSCNYSKDDFVTRPLLEALSTRYESDAHAVMYHVVGDGSHPRMLKSRVQEYPGHVVVGVFMADVDNVGHGRWTDETLAAARDVWASLDGVGVYATRGGYRVVRPLLEPLEVEETERYLYAWLMSLDLPFDKNAKDWTRHFRCPRVVREGTFVAPLFEDWSRMRPLDAKRDLAPMEPERPAPKTRSSKRRDAPRDFDVACSDAWRVKATVLGEVVKESVAVGEKHLCMLAIGGTLVRAGVSAEEVPAIVGAIAASAGFADPGHHERNARDSMRRYADGITVTGRHALSLGWPAVALAVDAATEDLVAAAQERDLNGPKKEEGQSADDAYAQIEKAIRDAPDGLTVIVSPCGAGKSHAARQVALEAANGPRRIGSKSSIASPTNKLSEQQYDYVKDTDGVVSLRVFGPTSYEVDGKPACIYVESANAILKAGQSIVREFCEGGVSRIRCEKYYECRAKEGQEGAEEGRIAFGTHALMGTLDEHRGKTGVLYVDEMPQVLKNEVLTKKEIRAAREDIDLFAGVWGSESMAQILEELDVHVKQDEVKPHPVWSEMPEEEVPSVKPYVMRQAMRNVQWAERVGAAGRVMRLVYEMTQPTTRTLLEGGSLFVTYEDRRIVNAIRAGKVVVLDATPDIPLLTKINDGYEPCISRVGARDGAPIRRALLGTNQATRAAWMVGGHPVVSCIAPKVRAALEWLGTYERVGIISFRTVVLALRAAMGEDVEAEWAAAGQREHALRKVHEAFDEMCAPWKGRVEWGYYGALRGLDHMADVDALVTLGDPFPHVGVVQMDADYVGVGWEDRLDQLCADELEQAHGRLRVIYRKRAGAALHVGRVVPRSWRGLGDAVERTTVANGRPHNAGRAGAEFIRSVAEAVGGVDVLAERMECGKRTLYRWMKGERRISGAAEVKLLEIAALIGLEP